MGKALMQRGLLWRSRLTSSRCCSSSTLDWGTSSNAEGRLGQKENADGGSLQGSFLEFLRRKPVYSDARPAAAAAASTTESHSAERPLNISSGALRLVPSPRGPLWKPYRSPDSVGEFFSKMDAAINVGRILREVGWNSRSRRQIEELKVPWTTLVVTQVLRQPLDKDAAWGFFQWLKSVQGYRHSQHTYNSMVEVYGRAKDVAGIQRVLDDMSAYGCGMNVVLFTTVIHWYHKADELDKALDMWNQMTRVGCQPNVVTYTMLMGMLANVRRFDKVGEMFRDMLCAACKPNVRTYTVLINCLARSGNLDAALLVFEKLDSLKASPTAATFRVLMDSAASVGDLELLKKLFDGMKKAELKPNTKMYFTIMDSLKKAGKLEEAGPLLKDMESVLVKNELLSHSQTEEGNEEHEDNNQNAPLQDLEVMEGLDRPLVDMKAFSTILLNWGPDTPAALEAANFRWDPWKVLRVLMGLKEARIAWKFFRWVEKQPGYKHDSFVYTKMISILGRAHHFSQLDTVLEELQNSGIQVSIVTMNSLIFSLAVAQKAKSAMKMYYWMQDMKVKPNARTYTTLIDMLVKEKNYEKAMVIYNEMLAADCKPDSHTYTVLIQCLGKEGKTEAALELLEKMPEYGCKPNVVTYTSLIGSHVECGEMKQAVALFKKMQDQGIKPNSVTYTLLARGLRQANMFDELLKIEKNMSGIEFWNYKRVSSSDETLVRETILSCLLRKESVAVA